MINIINIKLNIKVTVLGSLCIETSVISAPPCAIIYDGALYSLKNLFNGYYHYVRRNLSVSEYISILMDNCPDDLFTIAYV